MRVLHAEIKDQKLVIDGISPDDVQLLVEGEGNSKGIVILTGTDSYYLANTQPDLQETIAQLVALCDQLKTIGEYQYVIGATGQVKGTPLIGVSKKAGEIKSNLQKLKLI